MNVSKDDITAFAAAIHSVCVHRNILYRISFANIESKSDKMIVIFTKEPSLSIKALKEPNPYLLDWASPDKIEVQIPKPFFVYHNSQLIYTIIAATNIHHAWNKAAKELKNFSGIVSQRPSIDYKAIGVAAFNKLGE